MGSGTTIDVVVVGAGLAGLTAAHKIINAGLSCAVLEARDRIGGRTWSQKLPSSGAVIELGAAWINDTNQSRMYALAQRLGLELIEQNTTGDCVLQLSDGSLVTFPYGDLPQFSQTSSSELASTISMVESDCQAVDCAMPRDPGLDKISFAAYLKSRNVGEFAFATASVWTRAMLGQEPEDVSALYFLNYCKSGGGLVQMRSDRKHGGQYLRTRNGTQDFSIKLAEELPEGTLHFESPVTEIEQEKGGLVTVKAGCTQFQARKVIMAIPQVVVKTIAFEPPLPPSKIQLIEAFNYGYYTKVMLVFSKPFWVEKGFCGLAQSFKGPASIIRDTSVPVDKKWVLTCFLAGRPGKEWSDRSESDKENDLLVQINELWGGSLGIRQYFLESRGHEWKFEKYNGYGCPCPSLAPGVLETVGFALREPFLNVHFAGTETAVEWKGYMEGAVRSGERAADEVLAL